MKKTPWKLIVPLLALVTLLACTLTVFVYATEGDSNVEKPENAVYYNLQNGKFQLEWDGVPESDTYRIYQNGTLICETDMNIAIVPSGIYTIRAVTGGEESAFVSFSKGTGSFVSKETLCQEYLFLREELGASTFRDSKISVSQQMTEIHNILNNRSATKEMVAEMLSLIPTLKNTVLYSERNLVPNVKSYSISPDAFNSQYIKE